MNQVIKIENLSKKYLIGHRHQERYRTLRDALTGSCVALSRRFLRPPGRNENPASITEDFWALKEVSFHVDRGERVGIIGRNGAGKSTLLKILSRITPPSQGRVAIKGRIASLLEVGTGFHPELTGRENIFLNGAIIGMSKEEIRRKFAEIVAFAGVERFLDTPVKRYSSGMYVRLAFSVSVHLDPEILIVDEVLAVGDSQFQSKCLEKMREVADSGRTILFVSHNMGVIRNFCTRAILLDEGKVVAEGRPEETVDSYLSLCDRRTGAVLDADLSRFSSHGGAFVVEKLEMLRDGRQVSAIEMGTALSLAIQYRFNRSAGYLKFGIHFVDSLGHLVCVLSPNQQVADFTSKLSGSGTLVCTVRNLNLTPDLYRIDLHCHSSSDEEPFVIENAASFQVIEKDVYETGVIPSRVHGTTYFKAEWEF